MVLQGVCFGVESNGSGTYTNWQAPFSFHPRLMATQVVDRSERERAGTDEVLVKGRRPRNKKNQLEPQVIKSKGPQAAMWFLAD